MLTNISSPSYVLKWTHMFNRIERNCILAWTSKYAHNNERKRFDLIKYCHYLNATLLFTLLQERVNKHGPESIIALDWTVSKR